MNNFWWQIIFIVLFYFFLLIIDTAVFHNKISDLAKAFGNKIFLFLFILSLVMGGLFFISNPGQWYIAVVFIMYTVFLEKLIVRRMD